MNETAAQELLREIRRKMNPCHVACAQFRQGTLSKLAPDDTQSGATVLELHLTEALPGIHFF